MNEQITVLATFEPHPSKVDEFLTLMGPMVAESRLEPGCLRYDMFRDEEARYHLIEVYTDRDAIAAHRNSTHYRDYRAEVADLISSPIGVRFLHPVDIAEN